MKQYSKSASKQMYDTTAASKQAMKAAMANLLINAIGLGPRFARPRPRNNLKNKPRRSSRIAKHLVGSGRIQPQASKRANKQ